MRGKVLGKQEDRAHRDAHQDKPDHDQRDEDDDAGDKPHRADERPAKGAAHIAAAVDEHGVVGKEGHGIAHAHGLEGNRGKDPHQGYEYDDDTGDKARDRSVLRLDKERDAGCDHGKRHHKGTQAKTMAQRVGNGSRHNGLTGDDHHDKKHDAQCHKRDADEVVAQGARRRSLLLWRLALILRLRAPLAGTRL